ncbi:MAG: Asp-tRNA(Asn)/Glu-tRNA(Gln) amidotransferase subunit GatC [bacterium]|nr:Asp-tRNA(Asn)/Glu-tRNA(Gln) amidotransferase subunit GatC [bacterium]
MKEITVDDVEYAARLARLELTDEEKKSMTAQVRDVLNYVAKLNELNTDDVEPTAHVLPIKNVWRPDRREESLKADDVLGMAPKTHNGMLRVPRVLE